MLIWLKRYIDLTYITETIANYEDTDVYMNDGRFCADTKCLTNISFINITGFKIQTLL